MGFDGSGKRSVSVVLPAYNEAAVLESSLERVCAELRTLEAMFRWEVLVIDDGSRDATAEIAARFAQANPEVRLILHASNRNLGGALRTGFKHARGDYVIPLDTDLSYDPSHLELMLGAIVESGADMVIASPYGPEGRVTAVPPLRLLLSRGANKLLSLTAPGRLTTITGMVRAYDRSFVRSLHLRSSGSDINTEILYKAQLLGARIVEVPAHLDWTSQREVAEKRSSSMKIGAAILAQSFSSFLFRPLLFFVVPGLVLMVLSLYTLVLGAVRWFDLYGEVTGNAWVRIGAAAGAAFAERPHTFVIGGIAMVLAVQLLSLGIIATQVKRYFEELFALGTRVLRFHRDQAETENERQD